LVSQDQFRHEFIPYRLKPEKDGVVRLADTAAEQFLDQLRRRSQLLASDEALEQEWAGFCRAQAGRYMSALLGFGRVLAKLNRGGWMTRLLCTRSQLRSMGNVVRCESHREVLLTLAQLRLEEEREAARDHQPRRS
jgi:poly-gamma-glutamate synthesis protein (capsule biosynthesis protein)